MTLYAAGAALWWLLGLFAALAVLLWGVGWVSGLMHGYDRGQADAGNDAAARAGQSQGPARTVINPGDLDDTLIWVWRSAPDEIEIGRLAAAAEYRLGRLGQ